MIAIKNMKMPSCCNECPMFQSGDSDYCDITGEWISGVEMEIHENCPLVEIVTCKDCKHWRDSDGEYRRGCGAESKCPINSKRVYEGNCYCAYAERKD